MEQQWQEMEYATEKDFEEPLETGVPGKTLQNIAKKINSLPDDLVFFKKTIKLVEDACQDD